MEDLFTLEIKTDDELTIQMFNRYWKLNNEGEFSEKVPDLAKEYGLSSYDLRKKINEHCYCLSTIFECPNPECGEPKRYRSRNALKRDWQNIKYITPNWDNSDIPYIKSVIDQEFCNECKKREIIELEIREEKLNEEKRELIDKHYRVHEKPTINSDRIDLQDALYLIALLREGADEEYQKIRPADSFENKLAPTKELTISILNTLFFKKIISIHPDSDLNAFEFVNGTISNPDIFRVSWKSTFKITRDSIVDEILHLEKILENSEWPEEWLYQLDPLWKEIAYAEVLEFLIYLLDTHNIPFNPGKRTSKVITSLLNDFSPIDVCFIIWASLQTTLSFLARENASKQVATNYLFSCVQNYADDVKNGKKKIGKFNRNHACPISVVADIFYNKVLKIDGFREVPKY